MRYWLVLFLLICSPAWSATQLKKTVCPSGCDYTSLESAVNANEQNLVTADQYFDVEISGTWSSADTTAVTVHNYTTDATRYVNIYTTGSARHQGVWSTTAYRLIVESNPAGAGRGVITFNGVLNAGYFILDGLQIQNTITAGTYSAVINAGSSFNSLIVKSNIIRGGRRAIKNDYGYALYFLNNLVYGVGVSGLYCGSNVNWDIYSNTIVGATDGINRQNGTVVAKNNYVSATTAITGTVTQTTNATSDATATGTALDNITYSTSNFTNVNAGSEDLHLVVGSALIDVGTDLSGTFTTDIDGTTRTGTWDIGADEYVATSTSSVISINNATINNATFF